MWRFWHFYNENAGMVALRLDTSSPDPLPVDIAFVFSSGESGQVSAVVDGPTEVELSVPSVPGFPAT
jgi:hypothetical protein